MASGYGLVLLCESDHASVDATAEVLRGLHVSFALATSSDAAVRMRFHLEIAMMLVGGCPTPLDGFAAAREIRRVERAAGMQRVPILALMQEHVPMPELGETYFEAGIDGAIPAPVTSEAVLEALRLAKDGMYLND